MRQAAVIGAIVWAIAGLACVGCAKTPENAKVCFLLMMLPLLALMLAIGFMP